VKEVRCGIEALKCPADPLLKWFEVQNALAALQKKRSRATGSALKGELDAMSRLLVDSEDWSPRRYLSVTTLYSVGE